MTDRTPTAAGPDAETRVRRARIETIAGSPDSRREALEYLSGHFPWDVVHARAPVGVPLPDEPHLDAWRRYRAEAGADVIGYLRAHLPQLSVPACAGVSSTEAYRDVALRGKPFREESFGRRREWIAPSGISLEIRTGAAGALPVLATACRADFEGLVQALACRCEPEPIPPAVYAYTVAGITNWERVRHAREAWETRVRPSDAEAEWPAELRRLSRDDPGRLRDRVMLVCHGPYSGCSVADLGLDLSSAGWLAASLDIRVEHEMVHYATKRLFDVMKLNLLDEAICDALAFARVLGTVDARWMRTAMGLGAWPEVRPDGRLHAYTRGLTDGAVRAVAEAFWAACDPLAGIVRRHQRDVGGLRLLLALTQVPLDQLAWGDAERAFEAAWRRACALVESDE